MFNILTNARSIFCLILFLIFPFASTATGRGEDLSPILVSETTVGSARLLSDPIKNRWGVVELQASHFIGEGGIRNSMRRIMSVDCSNRGIEIIQIIFNIEADNDKQENWVGGPINERYKNGFTPEKIKHTPVIDSLKKERQEMLSNVSLEQRERLESIKQFFPEIEEAAVDFACSVIKGGVGIKEASNRARANGGVDGLKSLSCTFIDGAQSSNPPIELLVRFNEPRDFVQVQNVWRKTRSINSNSISVKYKDFDIYINRLSGRARLASGEFILPGNCDYADDKQKF